ncbi:alpha-elapitoxin-As2a-like [Arapaima gigas]
MNKILSGLVTVGVLFACAESLTCNSCSLGIFGRCFFGKTVTCNSTQGNCFTSNAAFTGILGFTGFTTQGCLDSALNSTCNTTNTGSILSATYTVNTTCCTTNNCNPVNGAPTFKFSLSAVTSAALLASLFIRSMY